MKVVALQSFFDMKERVDRNPGDEFEVTEARFKEINSRYEHDLVKAKATPRKKKAE